MWGQLECIRHSKGSFRKGREIPLHVPLSGFPINWVAVLVQSDVVRFNANLGQIFPNFIIRAFNSNFTHFQIFIFPFWNQYLISYYHKDYP